MNLDLLAPWLAVELRTEVVLPLHPVLLAFEDHLHRICERASRRRSLPQFPHGPRDCFLHPLRVCRLESEVEKQRAVPIIRPFVLGGLGEREKVMELDEQLEKELSSEMRVCNLCMQIHSTDESSRGG